MTENKIPEHYRKASIVLEPKDLLQYFPFFLGNACKYILRHQHKGQAQEDLMKAKDYLSWAKERKESPEYPARFIAPLFKNDLLNCLVPSGYDQEVQYDKAECLLEELITNRFRACSQAG